MFLNFDGSSTDEPTSRLSNHMKTVRLEMCHISLLSFWKCLISDYSFDFMPSLLPEDPLWLKHDISRLFLCHVHYLISAHTRCSVSAALVTDM